MKHPADRIRTTSLLAIFSLCWVIGDLWKIRRLARDVRVSERDLRRRHADELDSLDEMHAQRISEIRAEVDAQVEALRAPSRQ